MQYSYKPSYIRTLKAIKDIKRLKAIHKAIEKFQEAMETSCHPMPQGLGLKRLRRDIWEFRAGINDRIIIRWIDTLIEYGLVGTHDDIKNFLRHK